MYSACRFIILCTISVNLETVVSTQGPVAAFPCRPLDPPLNYLSSCLCVSLYGWTNTHCNNTLALQSSWVKWLSNRGSYVKQQQGLIPNPFAS